MKVYSTKLALTEGIQIVEGEYCKTGRFMVINDEWHISTYTDSKYIFTEKNDAIIHSEQLRENKIKSTLKQLSKLKALRFDNIPDITD